MSDARADTIWNALVSVAREVGDVDAVLAPGRTPLRFTDLVAHAADIRGTLCGLGIGRGDRVASALRHDPETIVCYFGVSACTTYVPLNPDYTEEEFTRYLARIRPQAVIVPAGGGTAMRSAAASAGIRIIDLHPNPTAPAGTFLLQSNEKGRPIEPAWAEADDIALILLTSGSTAQPKLVPIKHRYLTAIARAGKQHFGLGPRDRYLHIMPMFHGHGVKSGLTVPVLAGSAVICGPQFDVTSFFDTLHTMRPTWFSASYAIHQAILDNIDDHREIARHAQLRFIVSGSGRINDEVTRGLEAAFGTPVLTRYSMSETGPLSCMPLPPRIRKPGTAGVPLQCEVRVIDERGSFLEANAQGEIVARGASVFEGYLDDPAANARAFVDGWFRTGDLGFMDGDGHLTITGRIKELINHGGEKIAPGEVEREIAQHPAVAQVCVFGVPHRSLGEVVAAAVVPHAGALATERSIVEFAQSRLAAFKVPRCVLFTAAFPTGATGKIDRAALALQCASLAEELQVDVPSRAPSPVERDVAQLWQKLLKVQHVPRDLDFFLAGGDSLKAAQLALVVRRRFDVDISMRDFLDEGATVAGLAHLVERERSRVTALPANLMAIKADGSWPPLFAVPGSDGNPCSFIHFGRLIDARQPLYGLVSRGFDGARAPLDRMEEIAADHLATIRALQPKGPYRLIGACFGGRVAYEMARQLDAAGERADFLCMLDASPPHTDSHGVPRGHIDVRRASPGRFRLLRFVARRLRTYASEFMALDGRERAAFVRSKLALVREIALRRDPFRGDRSEFNAIGVFEANKAAGRRYVPRPYAGPAILVLTQGRVAPGVRNYRLDWLALMSQCAAPQYVPGRDTGDMLIPPNVQVLASRVNEWLQEPRATTTNAESVHAPLRVATT